jgi:hypothetical protein
MRFKAKADDRALRAVTRFAHNLTARATGSIETCFLTDQNTVRARLSSFMANRASTPLMAS